MTIKPNQLHRWWRTPRDRTNGELAEGREGENPWVYLQRAHGPVTRSTFISYKFDMICAEYDNSYQPLPLCSSLAQSLPLSCGIADRSPMALPVS